LPKTAGAEWRNHILQYWPAEEFISDLLDAQFLRINL